MSNINKKFIDRLESFLDSELNDYGFSYTWSQYDEERIEVTILKDDELCTSVAFEYDKENDDLKLYMSLDCDIVETVREFDHTVKYFWMLVAPEAFKK